MSLTVPTPCLNYPVANLHVLINVHTQAQACAQAHTRTNTHPQTHPHTKQLPYTCRQVDFALHYFANTAPIPLRINQLKFQFLSYWLLLLRGKKVNQYIRYRLYTIQTLYFSFVFIQRIHPLFVSKVNSCSKGHTSASKGLEIAYYFYII